MAEWVNRVRGAYTKFSKEVDEAFLSDSARGDLFWKRSSVPLHIRASSFACYDCGQTFSSYRALVSHNMLSHEYVSPMQYRIPDATCPLCLVHFGTRPRCLFHANKANTCNAVISQWTPQLSQKDLIDLRCKDADVMKSNMSSGLQPLFAENLCFLAEGPLESKEYSLSPAFCKRRLQYMRWDGEGVFSTSMFLIEDDTDAD